MNRALDTYDMNEAISAPCREKKELIINSGRERANRRVRFQLEHCTTVVRSEETFETLEKLKHLVWYQPTDIQQFQSNDEMMIKKYRSFVRNNQRLGRSKLNDVEKLEMEMVAEMRGLENTFNVLSQLSHQRRLEVSCRGVLNEQERQKKLWSKDLEANEPFLIDAESIRKVYANYSMNSKLIAYSLGRSDATFVRQFQKISPVKCHVLCNNKALRPLKPKDEKERTNVTASSILRQRQLNHINAFHSTCATRVSI